MIAKTSLDQADKFANSISLGEKIVSESAPCYLIAEIGANFDRSLAKAKELASVAAEAGADCVKFQTFKSEKIVSGKGFSSMTLRGVHGSWKKPVADVFRDAEFPREWHTELMQHCASLNVHFTSAPYDFEAVDLLDSLNVPFIKIGSGEITWPEMLEYISSKGRPVFLATGDSTLAEVDEAVRLIRKTGNRNLVLLQCITNYPSKIESANLRVLNTYRQAFGVITGYSDHTPGDIIPICAVALGAKVIEKHFTLDKEAAGPDHPHSLNPEEFRRMVERIRLVETALGDGRKDVVPEESETVIVQRRGLYVVRDLEPGQSLREEDVAVLRPALGISPKFRSVIIGRSVRRAMSAGEPLDWPDLA